MIAAMASELSFRTWLLEGVRAGALLRPRVGDARPGAWQLPALLLALVVAELVLSRLEVPGPAEFDVRGWLGPWWATAAVAVLAWIALARSGSIAAWLALWFAAMLPTTFVALGLGIAQARDLTPWMPQGGAVAWGVAIALWAWTVAIALKLAWHLGASWRGLALLGTGLVAVLMGAVLYFPDRPWQPDMAGAAVEAPPRLVLSQETIEAQQQAWTQAVARLAPQRPDVVDVYGLVFAPYAPEDVFLRESTMVSRVLAERFDAQGRVLELVNHATTAESLPWATPQNLRRAVEALAKKMDPEKDVLVVYLTSHGASDFRLAAANPPLAVEPVSPGELREALDQAGIRHRVIAVSACYSGGWIGPLGGDKALVMTAADETHTSYGCGRLSELTFFGRAVFDEQLRKTHSFEKAFAAAVPVIRQREQEAGKDDGFSNPQISVGEKIRPVLQQIEERLGKAAAR